MILRQIAIHALVLLSLGAWTQDSRGQAVTLAPTPTGLNDEVTLTIDVSQSAEHGLKAVLEANPDLPVYLWTWSPSDRRRQRVLEQQQRRHASSIHRRFEVHLDLRAK